MKSTFHRVLLFSLLSVRVTIFVDVAQERTHNALIAGVENFKSSSLKRTDTKEKIVLPNAKGNLKRKKLKIG